MSEQAQASRRPQWADLNAPLILAISIAGAVAVLDVALWVWALNNNATQSLYEQKVVAQPNWELDQYRSGQMSRLNSYGKSQAQPGKYQIPIDEAIRLYAAEQASK